MTAFVFGQGPGLNSGQSIAENQPEISPLFGWGFTVAPIGDVGAQTGYFNYLFPTLDPDTTPNSGDEFILWDYNGNGVADLGEPQWPIAASNTLDPDADAITADTLATPDAAGLQVGTGDINNVDTSANTNVWEAGNGNWSPVTSGAALTLLESYTKNFTSSDSRDTEGATFDRNIGNSVINWDGWNAETFGSGVTAGQDTRTTVFMDSDGLTSDFHFDVENPRGNTIRINPVSGSDTRLLENGDSASVYDFDRPWATFDAAYDAGSSGDTYVLEGGRAWNEIVNLDEDKDSVVDASRVENIPGIRVITTQIDTINKVIGKPNVRHEANVVGSSVLVFGGSTTLDLGSVSLIREGAGILVSASTNPIGYARITTGKIVVRGGANQGNNCSGIVVNTGVSTGVDINIEVNGGIDVISTRGLGVDITGESIPLFKNAQTSTSFVSNHSGRQQPHVTVNGDIRVGPTNGSAPSFIRAISFDSNCSIYVNGSAYSPHSVISGGLAKTHIEVTEGCFGGDFILASNANDNYRAVIDVDESGELSLDTPEVRFLQRDPASVLQSTPVNVSDFGGSVLRTNNGGQIAFRSHVNLISEYTGPNGGASNSSNSIIQMSGSSLAAGQTNQIIFYDGVTAWNGDFEINGAANNAAFVENNSNNSDVSDFIWFYDDCVTNVTLLETFSGVEFPSGNPPTLGALPLPSLNSQSGNIPIGVYINPNPVYTNN